MFKSNRKSGRNICSYAEDDNASSTGNYSILETLAAELWVKEVDKVVKSRYADGNGVALVGEDHLRKEAQYQAGVTKARIKQLMKGHEDDRDDDSSNISYMAKSKSVTFLKEVTKADDGPEQRCAKDFLRAIVTEKIDPNYKEKTMARDDGLWSGYFGDRSICDEESVEVQNCVCVERKSFVIGSW